jgi:hypothetical protein
MTIIDAARRTPHGAADPADTTIKHGVDSAIGCPSTSTSSNMA